MLSEQTRMTSADEFRRVSRAGRRSGTATLVTHLLVPRVEEVSVLSEGLGPARVGFVVGKTVGNAVARNRVKRRLRALVRSRLERLPRGALLVVRANGAAAAASSAELARDLDKCLDKCLGPVPA